MEEQTIKIGEVVKSHSYEGRVVVRMDSLKTDIISTEPEWIFIDRYGERVPYRVEYFSISDEGSFLLKVKDIDSEQTAKTLKGSGIYLEPRYLEFPTGDNTLLNPEGWMVYRQQEALGRVSRVLDHGTQQLLEVEYRGQYILIPWVADFVVEIDYERSQLKMDFPEGLLAL